MYRTSQKCLKLCRCVPRGALGGPGMSESTCKERSYSSDWKYDYRLDVLMKKLCTVGCFHTQGRFCRAGWHLWLSSRTFLNRKGEEWNARAKQTFLLQESQMLLSLHGALFKKWATFCWSLYNLISPLSSFYLRKGEFIIWSSMAQKCVIYYNSTVFLGDLKLKTKGGKHFWWM